MFSLWLHLKYRYFSSQAGQIGGGRVFKVKSPNTGFFIDFWRRIVNLYIKDVMKKGHVMPEQTLDSYTQDLYDKVASLRKEVANLRTAYLSADRQLNAMSHLADKTTSDAVKETIVAEEFVRLALESAQAAYQAAKILGNPALIEVTHHCLTVSQEALDYASASTSINADRQTKGGS